MNIENNQVTKRRPYTIRKENTLKNTLRREDPLKNTLRKKKKINILVNTIKKIGKNLLTKKKKKVNTTKSQDIDTNNKLRKYNETLRSQNRNENISSTFKRPRTRTIFNRPNAESSDTPKEDILYNVIFVLGPSASGKTYGIENYLLNELGENYEFVISLDGGDYRESSNIYDSDKNNKNEYYPYKHFKDQNAKKLIENEHIKTIKELLNSDDLDFKNLYDKISCNNTTYTDYPGESKSTLFRLKLFLNSLKFKNESIIAGDNKKLKRLKEEKNTLIKEIKKQILISNCDDLEYKYNKLNELFSKNYINKQKKINLAYVATATYVSLGKNIVLKDKTKNILDFENKFNSNNDNDNDKKDNYQMGDQIYFIVYCPKIICNLQGKLREKEEGKKFGGNKSYHSNIKGNENIVKNKIDEIFDENFLFDNNIENKINKIKKIKIYIYLNFGKYFDGLITNVNKNSISKLILEKYCEEELYNSRMINTIYNEIKKLNDNIKNFHIFFNDNKNNLIFKILNANNLEDDEKKKKLNKLKLLCYYFYNHINNTFNIIEELLTKQIVPFFNKYLNYIIKEQLSEINIYGEKINIKNEDKIANLDKIINNISSFKSNKLITSITSITELDNNYTKYNRESDYINNIKKSNKNSFKQEEEKLYEFIKFINENELEIYPKKFLLKVDVNAGGGSYLNKKILYKKSNNIKKPERKRKTLNKTKKINKRRTLKKKTKTKKKKTTKITNESKKKYNKSKKINYKKIKN